jgi:hypothetical protein
MRVGKGHPSPHPMELWNSKLESKVQIETTPTVTSKFQEPG